MSDSVSSSQSSVASFTDESRSRPSQTRRWWQAMGPALITASVVLGPGSILAASKTGAAYGNTLTWALLLAVVLMLSLTALAARIGVLLDHTPCEEVARRVGRPAAVLVGGTLFLIAACFQFGNNLGILFAIEPLIDSSAVATDEAKTVSLLSPPFLVVFALNGLALAALFGCKSLYRPLEVLMKVLVGLMVLGFAVNLVMARPDLGDVLAGLKPAIPDGDITVVLALLATTFSVAGAFYQAYLVRQKGWSARELKPGFLDSSLGISMLGLITLMILVTAATTLRDTKSTDLKSAADVALALQPLFGQTAMVLFCAGVFAGAFSSLLVNAMIGGTFLADGCGLSGDMNQLGPRILTAMALVMGMAVAIWMRTTGQEPSRLIIFAQALTVLGTPLLAITLVWLATREMVKHRGPTPRWLFAMACLATVVSCALAVNKAISLYGKLTTVD